MTAADTYGIEELAELGGVSRRTVRYYVQEGLLPAPLGVGRGKHYGREHLDRLLEVKALQESGHSLDDIRRLVRDRSGRGRERKAAAPRLLRTPYRRVELAPGVELHVAASVRMPPEHRLQELASWCLLHFYKDEDSDD